MLLSHVVKDKDALIALQTNLQKRGLYEGKIDGLAYEGTTKAFQTLLKDYGYSKDIDGDFGSASQEAMTRYMAESNDPSALALKKAMEAKGAAPPKQDPLKASVKEPTPVKTGDNNYAFLHPEHSDEAKAAPGALGYKGHHHDYGHMAAQDAADRAFPAFNVDAALGESARRAAEKPALVKQGLEGGLTGDCGRYVRYAAAAGYSDSLGKNNVFSQGIGETAKAGQAAYEKNGFKQVNPTKGLEPGDILIFQYAGAGHAEVFHGTNKNGDPVAVSDFAQNSLFPNEKSKNSGCVVLRAQNRVGKDFVDNAYQGKPYVAEALHTPAAPKKNLGRMYAANNTP